MHTATSGSTRCTQNRVFQHTYIRPDNLGSSFHSTDLANNLNYLFQLPKRRRSAIAVLT